MNTGLLAEMTECVAEAAQPIHRRYRQVERDDLAQEGWLWLAEHNEEAEELLAAGKKAALRFRLRRTMERYARREKAARSGYSPDDEVYYGIRALRELLPDALDPDAVPSQARQEVSVATSRTGYSEWEASMADVRSALGRLPLRDRELLELHYHEGWDPDALAARYGVTVVGVYRWLGRALRSLQRRLGGSNPSL